MNFKVNHLQDENRDLHAKHSQVANEHKEIATQFGLLRFKMSDLERENQILKSKLKTQPIPSTDIILSLQRKIQKIEHELEETRAQLSSAHAQLDLSRSGLLGNPSE